MKEVRRYLCQKLPCRENEIRTLCDFYSYVDEPFVDNLYISGSTSTGKSAIVTSVLQELKIKHTVINLIECYTSKILFENILNALMNYTIDPVKGLPFARCDSLMEFLLQLSICSQTTDLNQSVIVLDKAEKLRDMDMNLLPGFLRLKELSGLHISVIFISELEFIKLVPRAGLSPPVQMYFPQYSRDELLKIMMVDYDKSIMNGDEIVFNVEEDFYKNYLGVFLSVFYRACRDLSELRHLAKQNFYKYCEPIINNEIDKNNVSKLWRNISSTLKASLEVVYMRMSTFDCSTTQHNHMSAMHNKTQARNLELPFYAKYLLIAAYLASYNPAKEDKRLFMKYHGKKRKTTKQIKSKHRVSEQLNTQLGPKQFSFDRLLAIFYSVLEDKVGLNSNLLVQVSSLVELQLLTAMGDGVNLDGQKYKCNVNFEFIQTISKMVAFNIRKYLYDFI